MFWGGGLDKFMGVEMGFEASLLSFTRSGSRTWNIEFAMISWKDAVSYAIIYTHVFLAVDMPSLTFLKSVDPRPRQPLLGPATRMVGLIVLAQALLSANDKKYWKAAARKQFSEVTKSLDAVCDNSRIYWP